MIKLIPCELCAAKGKLWLGADDYVECPQCMGKREIEVGEYKVQAKTRRVYIPGTRPFDMVELPQRELVGDTLIRRT